MQNLARIAYELRRIALRAIQTAGSGHIGGSFSIAEIMSVLYFERMNIRPEAPDWPDRDRLVVSKGHCSAITYAALAKRGFCSVEDVMTFRKIDSCFSGHVSKEVPGVDASTGSLGQGLSIAVGMALAAKMFDKKYRTYVITGDGEIEEGQIWEAAMSAGSAKLDNLVWFLDNNDLQLDGRVCDVMNIYPIDDKLRAFNWNTLTIDGHDVDQLIAALDIAEGCKGKPTAIIAKTVKAKGVSFMEGVVKWHGGHPTKDEFTRAFKEIDQRIAEMEE